MVKKLIALIAVVAVAGGYYYYTVSARPAEAPTVNKVTIDRGNVTSVVQSTGTLQALRTVDIGSQVSGVVEALYADFNSIVKKGQVLAKLDPSLLQVQVDLQTANVERQKGEITSQEVQLANDQTNYDRTKQLFDKQLANQQQLDEAELRVKSRKTQLDAARKQLITNEANLNQAQLNLSYTIIRAPIDGVVVNRLVDEGQAVQSSVNVAQFFQLATDLRVLRLQALVDESEIGKIQPGMPVIFTVDSYGREEFRGEVMNIRLNAQTQNNVVTYPVWITAPNPDLKLRPSMTANLRIVLSTAANVTRVPNAAIRFRPTSDIYSALGLTAPTTATRLTGSGGAQAAGAAASGRNPNAGAARPARPGVDDPYAEIEDELATLPTLKADKIDELFAPVAQPVQRGTLWTWDPASKKLEEHRVTLGVTDGSFTQVLSGDIEPGTEVVSSVTMPTTAAARQQNSVFGGQQQPGGFGPQGGFGPPPGGGFGGPPGGFGGGGRGGF